MAKVQNTFLKSKMNKDLDARILPNGEYRDAQNAQISKSEGADVGNLENVLGNSVVADFQQSSQYSNSICIGHFADEVNNIVYLFFTNYTDSSNYDNPEYNPSAGNFIASYNELSNQSTILVKGAFLNFSTTHLITGVNVLDDLLFFTDNRNQPRVINTRLANPTAGSSSPSYYTTEDQISVAKYNPYKPMELYKKVVNVSGSGFPNVGSGECTMKDVSSLALPNGGICRGETTGGGTPQISDTINIVEGSIIGQLNSTVGLGGGTYGLDSCKVFLKNMTDGTLSDSGGYLESFTSTQLKIVDAGGASFTITVQSQQTIVINPNPYYDSTFSGDPEYLEDKFIRFAYRFKFVDNEYSIFSPFTQVLFIPKQDGYFLTRLEDNNPEKEDQSDAYRSTIVYFVENKVNDIGLRIPLPYLNYDLTSALKISEIDILYKESDALAVKVVETISIEKVNNSAATCLTNESAFAGGAIINVDNIKGGINIGDSVTGQGIPAGSVIIDPGFTPNNPSNPSSGTIKISNSLTNLDNNVFLTIGDPYYYTYQYKSIKPVKTLPESELVRVYDKIPVKALAQEVSGNRVIYGNFINKITPPTSLDYNIACTPKFSFEVNEMTASYVAGAATYAGTSTGAADTITISVTKTPTGGQGGFFPGMICTSPTYGAIIPDGTEVASTTNNVSIGTADITLTNTVTLPAGTVILIFEPGGDVQNNTSIVEYPSSSVKGNRNYQVGFVFSDRYGRQSSVILSDSKEEINIDGQVSKGSTLYSPYVDEELGKNNWPGNSLKIRVNKPINENIYNGDTTSSLYNPGGWYSYKVVVKQTEQEYYNVYLPGIMSSYPDNQTKELGTTSHIALINDNINKVPRDLTEVGPEQKQFRSSIRLFGRVQNLPDSASSAGLGERNNQFYPGNISDTVSTISTMNDLFDYNPAQPAQPNLFPQFYAFESNPLIARITTEKLVGQISTTDYLIGSARGSISTTQPVYRTSTSTSETNTPTQPSGPTVTVEITSIKGTIQPGMRVYATGVEEEMYVSAVNLTTAPFTFSIQDKNTVPFAINYETTTQFQFVETEGFSNGFKLKKPGIQYLAVYETEPTESALDIYWETTTAGLISDLNSAIINNQAETGPQRIEWNPIFTEGLAENGFILSGVGITLLDSFDQTINLTPGSSDYFELFEARNGNGDKVAGSVDGDTIGEYFNLIDSSGTGIGPWQIQARSSSTGPSDYWDAVYYMYNEAGSNTNPLREFTFVFKGSVGGLDFEFTEQASLANEPPNVYLVETFSSNTGLGGAPVRKVFSNNSVDPNVLPLPNDLEFTIETNPSAGNIFREGVASNEYFSEIIFDNGAANVVGGNRLARRDVNPVNSAGQSYEQTITNEEGSSAEETVYQATTVFRVSTQSFSGSQFNESSDLPLIQKIPFTTYKTTLEETPTTGSLRQKIILARNPDYNDEVFGELSSTTYYITIRLKDAGQGDFTDIKILLDMRLQIPSQGRVYNKAFTVSVSRGSNKQQNFFQPNYYGPTQFGSFRRTNSGRYWGGTENLCGECGFRSPTWWNDENSLNTSFPATMIIVDKDDPGATPDSAGVYIYAGGMLSNGNTIDGEYNNTYINGEDGGSRAPSRPMVGAGGYFSGNSIEIPLMNPNSKGHKVQTNFRGGFTPADGTFQSSPHILGTAVVKSNSYAGGSNRGQCILDLDSIQGHVGTCMKGYPPALGNIAPNPRLSVGDTQEGMFSGGQDPALNPAGGFGYGFPLYGNGNSQKRIYSSGGPYRHRGPIISYFNPQTGEIKQIDNSGPNTQVPWSDSKYWRQGDLIRFYGGSTKTPSAYPVDVNRGSLTSQELNPWYFYPFYEDDGVTPTVDTTTSNCNTSICPEHYKRAQNYFIYSAWASGSRSAAEFSFDRGIPTPMGSFNSTWWRPSTQGQNFNSSDGNAEYHPWNSAVAGFNPAEINPAPNFVNQLTFSIT